MVSACLWKEEPLPCWYSNVICLTSTEYICLWGMWRTSGISEHLHSWTLSEPSLLSLSHAWEIGSIENLSDFLTGSGRSVSVYAVVTVVHHASCLGSVPLSPIFPHTLPCPFLLISTLNKQHHSPFKWVCRFSVKLHSLARTTGAQRSWMRMRNSKNSCGAEVSTTNKDVWSNKRSFERNLLESNSSPEMILYNQSTLTHHPRLLRGVWIPLVS